MKKTMTAILVLVGCGGGGGGGANGEEVCRDYCDFACAKTVLCIGATQNDAAVCSASCVRAFEGDFDADSCGSAGAAVGDMSCAELLRFLGLARRAERNMTPLDGAPLSDIDRLFAGE